MALYIPHSIFHLARLLYVRPETFGPYYVCYVSVNLLCILCDSKKSLIVLIGFKFPFGISLLRPTIIPSLHSGGGKKNFGQGT